MFKGKAIYNPSGKAGEYSYWACNFHVGCSNDCSYCYCKKGVLAHAMGGKTAALKKCFKDEADAIEIFEKELMQNLSDLRKHGLFFTFTSDPMLPETIGLTIKAVKICVFYDVKVKILTKCADLQEFFRPLTSGSALLEQITHIAYTKNVAFGFTLTGHDELEPGASTNQERIEAMKILHEGGYKTFASIEPIVDFESSGVMIKKCAPFCDLFKIGLMSGQKVDQKFKDDLKMFVGHVNYRISMRGSKVYWKDSITKITGPIDAICGVDRDFNLFE